MSELVDTRPAFLETIQKVQIELGVPPSPISQDAPETLNYFDKIIQYMIDGVAEGKEDPEQVARLALCAGYLLIGGTKAQKVHYPTSARNHTRYLTNNTLVNITRSPDDRALIATSSPPVAIATALWGSLNNINQRRERLQQCGITPPARGFGFVTDRNKTAFDIRANGKHLANDPTLHANVSLAPNEAAAVKIYALAELINAARDPDNPLSGVVHFVRTGDVDDWTEVIIPGTGTVESSTWASCKPRRTVMSMPVNGFHLPPDIIPGMYNEEGI
jgi:hypothetical protein